MHPPPRLNVVFSRGWSFEQVNRVQLNNMGYRANTDYTPADHSIAVLGDSYVESQMLQPANALPGLLQSSDSPRKVFNLGVSGASLADSLVYARWSRDHLRIDTAIVTLIGGDISESWDVHPGLNHLQRTDGNIRVVHVPFPARSRLLLTIFSSSSLMRYLKLNLSFVERFGFHQTPIEANKKAADPTRKCDQDGDVLAAATYLADRFVELQNRGLRILFLLDPPRGNAGVASSECDRDVDVFGRIARQRGLQVLDLGPAFRAASDHGVKIDYKPADAHWNAAGHRIAAEATHRWLASQASPAE